MFGLFKKQIHHDDVIGELVRSSGEWRGNIKLPGTDCVEIRLSGSRKEPDIDCLSFAHQLPHKFECLERQIRTSLFVHYEPYKSAFDEGEIEEEEEPFPNIVSSDEVLQHAWIDHLLIEPLKGAPTKEPVIEIAYRVAWDCEHTVGARIQNWKLFELCGSV